MAFAPAEKIREFLYDWRLVYTPKLIVKELHINFLGTGWYVLQCGTYLILPIDRKMEDALKADVIANERFEVYYYDKRDPRKAFQTIAQISTYHENNENENRLL